MPPGHDKSVNHSKTISFVKTTSFIWFSLITFIFSWLAWLPIIIWDLSTVESPAGVPLFALGGFGPTVVGAFFILSSKERKTLWSRIFDPRRTGWLWLLVALLIYPAIFLVSALLILPFGATWPEAEPLISMLSGPRSFIVSTIIILLLGPVSEEVGWRGYALEKMQQVWSPMKTSLIVGVIWWAWHLPLFFMPDTLHGSQGLLSAFTAGYFLTVVSYSILFTWLYNSTKKSILVAILAHFSINFTLGTLPPFDGSLFIITTVLLLVLGIGLWLKDRSLGYRSSAKKNRE